MFAKIDHLNMSVHDLNESLAWYHKVFGFEKREAGVGPSGTPWAITALGDVLLCLYQHPSRLPADENDEKFLRLDHFGFRINDRRAWEKIVKEHDLKLLYGGEPILYPRSVSWYVVDPSGYEIEISYVPDGGGIYG